MSSPVGLAFSSATKAFYVLGGRPGSQTTLSEADVAKLTPFDNSAVSDRSGSARLAAAVEDPINIAFDPRGNRLLLLGHARQLLEVRALAGGDLDRLSLKRRDATRLGLRKPQGMAVDPASGAVYVLDSGSSSIVRVEPDASGNFESGTRSEIDLRPSGLTRARGLAFDPGTGHLQVGSGQTLVELTTAGEVVSTRDLSGLEVAAPEGMVFAPSGDSTDAPTESSLYVADSGTASGTGQIVELSLAPEAAAAAATFTSQLVRTVDMGALSPPSPDPSGITYVPSGDKLVVSDAEVEETVGGVTHFRGATVWELTRSGSIIRTSNISKRQPTSAPMTDEPTGMAWKPGNGHYFVSEDGGRRVYDLNPGGDGQIGTADDSWTFFRTNVAPNNNDDPEGITYDTANDRLFVADGVNREIYQYTTSGTVIGHFDVQRYGVEDPETVEYNPVSGTLFVLSNRQSGPIIVETTTGGALIQTIDVSAAGAQKPAGLAYANASNGSGAKRFYWVDRGIDNNSNKNAVDGKLYEMTAPGGGGPPSNSPPQVSAGPDRTITLPAAASLDGTVTDDGLPNPPGTVTSTWTKQSGPGNVTFGNPNAVDTTASFSQDGTYTLRLTASDSDLSAFDEMVVTANPSGGGGTQVFEVRVSAAADDAEEVSGTGQVQRGDGDLDMMTDTGDTKLVVGTRFLGVAIPPGASISNAWVQFTADEVHSDATSLTIRGQAADNPTVFTTTAFNLSTRPTTAASAAWSPGAWLAVGAAGSAQRTTNLAAIIQELVNRPGWASGNAVVLLVRGSGRRVAVAQNKNPAAAALLHVEWS